MRSTGSYLQLTTQFYIIFTFFDIVAVKLQVHFLSRDIMMVFRYNNHTANERVEPK